MSYGRLSGVAKARLPRTWVKSWLTGFVALAFILLIGLWWIGGGSHWTSAPPLSRVGQLFTGLAAVLAGNSDGVTVSLSVRIAFLVGAVALIWVWRRTMIASLGYKPGPVEVREFIDASAGMAPTAPIVHNLVERLRKQLSETHPLSSGILKF